MPCPGTRLWKRLEEEGRLRTQGFRWKNFNLYSAMHEHAHMTDEQVFFWVDETMRRLFYTNGPSILRTYEVYLNGYRSLKDNPDPFVQGRVRRLRKWCHIYRSGLLAIKVFAPSDAVRKKVDRMKKEHAELCGPVGPAIWCKSVILLLVAACLKLRRKFPPRPRQPQFRRFEYNGAGA